VQGCPAGAVAGALEEVVDWCVHRAY